MNRRWNRMAGLGVVLALLACAMAAAETSTPARPAPSSQLIRPIRQAAEAVRIGPELPVKAVTVLYDNMIGQDTRRQAFGILVEVGALPLVRQALLSNDDGLVDLAAGFVGAREDRASVPYLVNALERHNYGLQLSEGANLELLKYGLVQATGWASGLREDADRALPAVRGRFIAPLTVAEFVGKVRDWAREQGIEMFPPAAPAVPQEPPTVERSIDLIINKADTTADEAVRQSMRERLTRLRARIDAGLAATAASGDPAAPPAAAPDAASVSGLLSGDAAVRRHTSDAITAKRKEVVSALVDLIRDAGNLQDRPESVAAAVRLLGELRAAEGVEAIVGVMKHRANSNGSVTRLPGFWWDKPLEGTPEYALIQIGEPCVPALIETLASSDEIRGGCLCVLVHLHSRAEVASLLHEAVVREPDQERLRRLMNALSALGEMPPEDKLPRSMEEVISKQGERAGGQ